MQTHILTVTQLTLRVKDLLEGTFPDVWVVGEISNLNAPRSGHIYFTLKDEQSQIRAVLFRSSQRFLKFTLQHGLQVICRGRVGVYEPRGEYQLVLEYIEPKGVGALQQAFEELKARLAKEGLFDLDRKKPLPLLPRRIGIITSPTGAAIRDMLRVIRRRHPKMEILIYPVAVQGATAAPEIIGAIHYFNKEKSADVLIVGRGGGSLEDLWAFNEESVARAISASTIPIISAVGHETDYTVSDFVADLRAPTPSAAAEMVVRTEEGFREFIGSLESGLVRSIRRKIELFRAALREKMRLLGDPGRRLEQYAQRVDELLGRLATGFGYHLRRDRALLLSLTGGLEHLNPLGILSRGYSITKKLPEGIVLKNEADVEPGDLISTRLHKGEVWSRVEKKREDSGGNY
ncbi:MAG TPA: exodeoxyribonuclease VII large subunit [Nitrospirota bacterium]|nr:exodeoxyribonuclease VII large subunit [Nitrospirota bacterium]